MVSGIWFYVTIIVERFFDKAVNTFQGFFFILFDPNKILQQHEIGYANVAGGFKNRVIAASASID